MRCVNLTASPREVETQTHMSRVSRTERPHATEDDAPSRSALVKMCNQLWYAAHRRHIA